MPKHVELVNFSLAGVQSAHHAIQLGNLFALYCSRNNVCVEQNRSYLLLKNTDSCITISVDKCIPTDGGLVDMNRSQISYSAENPSVVNEPIAFKWQSPTEFPMFFGEKNMTLLAHYDETDSCGIAVSMNTMVALGCTNGSMVMIGTPNKSRHTYVYLSDAPSPLVDGICVIPYTIYFSIFTQIGYTDMVTISKVNDHKIGYIGSAVVQKLPTLCISNKDSYLESNEMLSLKRYFMTPRILQNKDIIRLKNAILHPFHHRTMYTYYQITLLESEGILDTEHSTLNEQPFNHSVTFTDLKHYFQASIHHPPSLPASDYLISGLHNEYPLISEALKHNGMMIFRLVGPAGSGKFGLCKYLGNTFPVFSIDLCQHIDEMPTGLEKYLILTKQKIIENDAIKFYGKGIIHVRHIDILKDPHVLYDKIYQHLNQMSVVIVETCRETKNVAKSTCAHEISLSLPNDHVRGAIVSALCPNLTANDHFQIVQQSKSFNRREVYALCQRMKHTLCDQEKTLNDFNQHRDRLKKYLNELSVMPSIPVVQWTDIGGLEEAKQLLEETIVWPSKFPSFFKGMRHRSGVLLYGPPGTGKTMLAKAVATSCQRAFIAVKGPELMDMYVGESERHVRLLFEQARASQPCIIFFDELDALAPQRGANGDSGGVMDRMVSQLLTEMDRLDDIIMMGATNRPDLVDSSLLRTGRFEVKIYVGPSETIEGHISLLRAQMNGMTIDDDDDDGVDLYNVAMSCPKYLTGANAYSICSNALMNAIKRTTEEAKKKYMEEPDVCFKEYLEKYGVKINHEDIQKALATLTSILTESDIQQYKKCK